MLFDGLYDWLMFVIVWGGVILEGVLWFLIVMWVKVDWDCVVVVGVFVLVKVYCDCLMIVVDEVYFGYYWLGNKGYVSVDYYVVIGEFGVMLFYCWSWFW